MPEPTGHQRTTAIFSIKEKERTACGVEERLGKLEIFHYRNIMTNTIGGKKLEEQDKMGKGK